MGYASSPGNQCGLDQQDRAECDAQYMGNLLFRIYTMYTKLDRRPGWPLEVLHYPVLLDMLLQFTYRPTGSKAPLKL